MMVLGDLISIICIYETPEVLLAIILRNDGFSIIKKHLPSASWQTRVGANKKDKVLYSTPLFVYSIIA